MIKPLNPNEPPPLDDDRIEIVQLGGYVHYSQEMLCHLSRLPKEEANRIVSEIEYRNRPRRIYRVRET